MIAWLRSILGWAIPFGSFLGRWMMRRRIRAYKSTQRRLAQQYGITDHTPISSYADLADNIEAYVAEQPPNSIFLAETSGTTGTPKKIPYTKKRIRAFTVDSAMAGLISFGHYRCQRSDLYVLSSRKQDSSFTALTMHRGSARPHWIKALIYPSAHERDPCLEPLYAQYGSVAVRLWLMMLTEPGILYCTNPSTLSVFLEEVYTNWAHSKQAALDWASNKLPPGDWNSFVSRLGIKRSKQDILLITREHCPPIFSVLFPHVQAYCSWDGGYVGRYLAHIRSYIPKSVQHIPMYSMSTESVQTLPFSDAAHLAYVPIAPNVRYEFLSVNANETTLLEAWALSEGEEYIMIISNEYGLKRYQSDDVFLCTGFIQGLPDLRFLRRHGLRWSFTGEKITGEQIRAAWDMLCSTHNLCAFEMTLIPSFPSKALCPHYILCLAQVSEGSVNNTLADQFDIHLQAVNEEYASKRSSGRLNPIALEVHPFAHVAAMLDTRTQDQDDIDLSVWESQFKLPPLWRKLRS